MGLCTAKLTVWKPRHLNFFPPSPSLSHSFLLFHPPTPVNESARVGINSLALSDRLFPLVQYPSIDLSVYLSMSLYHPVSLSMYSICLCLSVDLSISVSFSPSLSVFLSLISILSLYSSGYLHLYTSIFYLSIHLYLCLYPSMSLKQYSIFVVSL